ncbi:MAG: NAD(P)/FAD-dependent oxidoreductase [Ktedonobacteraceae bacterium]
MSDRAVAVPSQQYKSECADIVIIGNGIAGLTAALEARELAPSASIAIITDQSHPTINTPALKQFAVGKMTQEQLLAFPSSTERTQRIHVINARVENIHAQGKFVSLRGGYGFGYGSLLIATGSVPNGLPAHLPGRDFDGVLSLHNLHDYLNLRRRLSEVDSAVVIGGGTHAIETVMSLLHYGIEVHWLIRSDTFLPRILDQAASEMVVDTIRNAGVKVYTSTEVIGIVGRVGSVAGVVTNQQKMIPCQMVLTCTGTSPVTTLAESCDVPMVHARGIYVDDQLRTSVYDVYAAGDVAARKNLLTGRYETQAQWYAAAMQGRTVAAAMTGHSELAAKPPGVSWHATHVGELFMLTVGNPINQMKGSETLTNSGKKKYCRMSIVDDRLVGYLSLGTTQPDSLAIKRIIDEELSVSDVKKALLKGKFDARKYFSGWNSRSARELVTSGKLPAVIVTPAQYSPRPRSPLYVSALPLLPLALPMVKMNPQRITAALPEASVPAASNTMHVDMSTDEGTYHTEPLLDSVPTTLVYNQATIHAWEGPVVPSTDPSTGKGLVIPSDDPSTGSQPILEQHGITAKLVSLPSRSVTRNLWSYSAKMPTVSTHKPASQGLLARSKATNYIDQKGE